MTLCRYYYTTTYTSVKLYSLEGIIDIGLRDFFLSSDGLESPHQPSSHLIHDGIGDTTATSPAKDHNKKQEY